jgi:hypothetical protein
MTVQPQASDYEEEEPKGKRKGGEDAKHPT